MANIRKSPFSVRDLSRRLTIIIETSCMSGLCCMNQGSVWINRVLYKLFGASGDSSKATYK